MSSRKYTRINLQKLHWEIEDQTKAFPQLEAADSQYGTPLSAPVCQYPPLRLYCSHPDTWHNM